jgi:sulfur carrier protein ThiS
MRMKIRVKLFGILPQRYPDYDSSQGLEVEIPEGARVKDLLARLEISASDGGLVAIDNLVVQHDHELEAGVSVRIFQRAFGG